MGILGVHNIGKVLELRLCEIGVNSIEELKALGTEKTFLRLHSVNKNTGRSILYSLEGAIVGVRWHDLDEKRKIELQSFFDSIANNSDTKK